MPSKQSSKKQTRKTSSKKKSQWTKQWNQRYPARFRQGWFQHKINKAVTKAVANVSELKLSPIASLNQTFPTQLGTTLCASYNMVTGSTVPSAYTGVWRAMDGFTFPQNDSITGRVGKYVYLKKTTFNLRIDMRPTSSQEPPINFRVIVYKHRRAMDPVGNTTNPSNGLFLDNSGQNYGLLSAARNGNDFQMGMLNKRNFIILKDDKFTLQSYESASTHQGLQYKSARQYKFTFNHSRKCGFGALGEPGDYDYRYGVVVLAIPQDIVAGNVADYWSCSTRGSTSALDM